MADRVSKADDKTRREIVLALVDRITIETIREGEDARTTARVRYAFDPPPVERYTNRLNRLLAGRFKIEKSLAAVQANMIAFGQLLPRVPISRVPPVTTATEP